MDKRGSGAPSEERGKGEAAAVAAIRERIAKLATMYASTGSSIDLGDVWDSDDFRALGPDGRNEIVAWAREKGYPTPAERPETPRPQKAEAVEEERTPDAVKPLQRRIQTLVTMYRSGGAPIDLEDVWSSKDFYALSEDDRAWLSVWAADQGYPVPGRVLSGDDGGERTEAAPAAADEPAPVEDAAATREPERPAEGAAAREDEKKEGGERQRKRRFLGYRADIADDAVTIVEDFEEWNKDAEKYQQRSVRTAISFPPDVAAAMRDDESFRKTVLDACDAVRLELERSNVKMFFDRSKEDQKAIFPKWKYRLDGRQQVDQIRPDDVPPEILDLVRDRPDDYFKLPEYKKWFGKQLQRKRETIVMNAVAAKLWPAEAPAETPAPPREPELAPKHDETPRAETAAPEEAPASTEIPPEFIEGTRMLVAKFAPLFTMPDQAKDLAAYVTKFTKGIFDYQGIKKGKAAPAPSAEAIRDLVREALLAHFAGQPENVAALEKAVGASAAPAPEAKAPAERERTPEDPAYLALRQEADALASPDDLERFIASLEDLRKTGLGTMRQAAEKALVDIEHGKLGPLSEERMTGLRRSAKEAAFFRDHAKLDRRNVELLDDGRLIAHIDRLRPSEALSRAFRRVVEDATERAGHAVGEALSAKVAEYLARTVEGKGNEAVAARFKGLAEFDAESGELVIRDVEKLAAIVANLIKDIERRPKA